jgi:Fe/S biogenesis protein NfuA
MLLASIRISACPRRVPQEFWHRKGTEATMAEVKVSVSEAAVAKLNEVIEEYPEDVTGLRLKITGRGADGFEHALTLVEAGYEPEGDTIIEVSGLRIYVERENVEKLNGVSVDYEFKGPNTSGLQFANPNEAWSDSTAMLIQRILDEQVNPQIAAHGGVITLLDYRDGKAYVEMGGGCAGCAQADVTLKQGVEVALKEAIPEIEEVIDTTDHDSGANPYYQPSKK